MADPKIIVALDFPEPSQALALADALDPRACRLKVGKEMFTRSGPALVEELQSKGFEIFLDLKFHDIPNTVARACRAAADLGVWMVNVHALGGRRMMEAAREALANCERRPLLIAVTVLTSMDQDDVREVGLMGTPWDNVERLAALARSSGLDGVVCSAQEAVGLRRSLGEDFTLVTPGIRLANAAPDDQRRTMTPLEALRSGASYLVMGRPITGSDDPCTTLRTINSEISVMTKASS